MDAHATIDPGTFHELQELMGVEFVNELIDTYILESGELIAGLYQALAANDAPVFGRLAHSLKSSSASLGALALSQQARELELMGKRNDLSSADPVLEQFATDFQQVKRRMEELKK